MSLVVRSETNAVAVPAEHGNQQIAYIATWAQAADAALRVATELVETSFVPVAYRKKPMEATAAILAGAEVGLNPMASLRAFDNIQGTPAPKAITLRAIALGMGHDVVIEEASETKAVVAVRRRGTDKWQRSVWDLDRARRMGLLNKDQWKNQPGAMLVARATSEGCRWVAADAIMGMPYSAEEIQDGDGEQARETPRRVSLADIDDAEDEAPASATVEVGEVKPVTGPPAAVAPEPMPENRSRRMFAMFRDAGLATKEEQLAYIEVVIGRAIASRAELTAAEGEQIIDALDRTIAENNRATPQDGAE